jgi:Holliday junction resolvase
MAVLADEGWLCGSRRHIGGAGDILAVNNRTGWPEVYLIEVKSTTRSPWVNFGQQDRQAMVETAERHGCEAWLYWWPPRRDLQRIPTSEWPPLRNTQHQLETS